MTALHPMQAFAKLQGEMERFRVNRLEDRLKPLVPFPHKHDFFHLLAIEKGSGWHEIDFVRTRLQPGLFFFMKPGQVHAWELSRSTRGYVIEFETSALDPAWANVADAWKMPDALIIPKTARPAIFGACAELLREAEAPRAGHALLTRLELGALLVRLARVAGLSIDSATSPEAEVVRFQSALEEHFRSEHGVEFYAKKAGLPAKAFAMRIARALGRSPRDLIQDRCLLEARRLLAYSDLSVSEVSESLGFETPNYFARLFRAKTRTTPGDFRKEVRKRSGR